VRGRLFRRGGGGTGRLGGGGKKDRCGKKGIGELSRPIIEEGVLLLPFGGDSVGRLLSRRGGRWPGGGNQCGSPEEIVSWGKGKSGS